MAKYILFDTETTGNQEPDRIIQAGALIVDTNGAVEVFDELCSCSQPISIEAMEVHNITPDALIDKPSFKQTRFFQTLEKLNTPENFLIAHNMPFDLGMLEKEGFKSKLQLIDTLRCARHLYGDAPRHRLQYLRYYLELYKLEEGEAQKHHITLRAHDAIGDVLVMKLLLSKLVARVRTDFPQTNPMSQLVVLTQTPIFVETFKFGKYKGKKIVDVCDDDMGYINWMLDNVELDSDMKYTLDKIMGHIE